MQVALDSHDGTTVYADLREEESLTDALRIRAIERAQQLGAQHVEFWHPPYGRGWVTPVSVRWHRASARAGHLALSRGDPG